VCVHSIDSGWKDRFTADRSRTCKEFRAFERNQLATPVAITNETFVSFVFALGGLFRPSSSMQSYTGRVYRRVGDDDAHKTLSRLESIILLST
jgi:hypothetical protein